MLKVSNSHGVYQNEKMFFVKITKNKETFTFGPYETKKKAQFSYDRQREKMFNKGPYNFPSQLEIEGIIDSKVINGKTMYLVTYVEQPERSKWFEEFDIEIKYIEKFKCLKNISGFNNVSFEKSNNNLSVELHKIFIKDNKQKERNPKRKQNQHQDKVKRRKFTNEEAGFENSNIFENDHQIVTERSMERIDLTKHQTFKVCFKSSYHCNLCKNILIPGNFEIDHIIPLCCGGRNHYDNLQALCYTCHKFKTNIVDPRTRSKYMNKENINEANVIFLQTSLKIREDKGEII
jgi:5-methylcytosine-specific restriction endonuclease McrA